MVVNNKMYYNIKKYFVYVFYHVNLIGDCTFVLQSTVERYFSETVDRY